MGFRGDLKDIDLANIFQTLGMNQHEGILRVSDSKRTAEIYFDKRGIRLLVNDRKPYTLLGELLLRRQLVKEVDLHRALKIQHATGRRMGEILVEEGYLAAEDLAKVLREQMEEKIYEIFSWNEAKFQFDAGVPPPEDPFFSEDRGQADYLTFNINSIMMEAARRIDEWGLINEVIPNRTEVPILLRPTKEVLADDYEIPPEVVSDIVSLVNGHRSVESIIKAGGHGNFKTCKILKLLIDKGNAGFIPTEELVRLANSYLTAQRTDEGVEAYRTATARHPDDIDIRLRFAEAALDQGLTKVAGEVYREIAYIHEELGDPRKALASYTTAVELNEADEASHERLYLLYRELNEKDLAREEGRILAKIKADNNRFNEAEDILVELKDDYILDVSVIKQLIKIYLERKEKGKAIAELEALGHTCEIKRRFPEAEEAYQMVLRLDKDRHDIREKLEQISTQAIKSKSRPKMGKFLLTILILAVVGTVGFFLYRKIDFVRRAGAELDGISEAFLALEGIPEANDPEIFEKLKEETAVLLERLDAFREEFGSREGVVPLGLEIGGRLDRLDDRITTLRERRLKETERLLGDAKRKRQEGRLGEALALAERIMGSPDTWPSVLDDARLLKRQIEDYQSEAAKVAEEAEGHLAEKKYKEARDDWKRLLDEFEHAEVARSITFPLYLSTEPAGADVYLDGVRQGTSPCVVRYDPDLSGTIELRREGFVTSTLPVSVVDRSDLDRAEHTVTLVKAIERAFNKTGARWEGAVEADLLAAEGSVFAVTSKGEILGIDAAAESPDGALTWSLPTNKFNRIEAPPVHGNGMLFVGLALQKGGRVMGIDAATGREGWRVTFDGIVNKVQAPLVLSDDGGTLLVASGEEVHALDASDGRRIWSRDVGSRVEVPPVIVEDVVLLPVPGSTEVLRLKLEDGEGMQPSLTLPDVPTGPLSHGAQEGILVVPGSEYVRGVSATTFEEIWHKELEGVRHVRVVGDKVWVSLRGGMAHLLEVVNGDQVWAIDLSGHGTVLGPVISSGSTLYLGTGSGIGLAIDAASGETLWSLSLKLPESERVSPVVGAPCLARGLLFFGCSDGRVYATLP